MRAAVQVQDNLGTRLGAFSRARGEERVVYGPFGLPLRGSLVDLSVKKGCDEKGCTP